MKKHERRPDPTPEEIFHACAEIRKTWTEKQKFDASGKIEKEYVPTVYTLSVPRNTLSSELEPDICDSEYWQWSLPCLTEQTKND